MKVQFKKGMENPYFTPGNIYRVIGIEADDFRIIDDTGKPYLYSRKEFDIIEKGGEDWITQYGEDGEEYSYPKELMRPGFFEDYFDRDKKTIAIFDLYVSKLIGTYIGPVNVSKIIEKITNKKRTG